MQVNRVAHAWVYTMHSYLLQKKETKTNEGENKFIRFTYKCVILMSKTIFI